ncbi:MAG: hypothetical protein DRI36_05430, partial [Caldiserica bacterium]
TREVAREWILKNIPHGAKILRTHSTPELADTRYRVRVDWWEKYKGMKGKDIAFEFDYLISSSKNYAFQPGLKLLKVFKGKKTELTSFHNPTVYIYKLVANSE